MQGVYFSDGIDKVLYTDGKGIGIRSDYNGVLLLDTILQPPVSKSEDIVKLELLLSEATILLQCLQYIELPGVEHLLEVLQELSSKIVAAQAIQKKGIKAQKVSMHLQGYSDIVSLIIHWRQSILVRTKSLEAFEFRSKDPPPEVKYFSKINFRNVQYIVNLFLSVYLIQFNFCLNSILTRKNKLSEKKNNDDL